MVVSWEFRAKMEFQHAYEYIKEDSFKNAESVRKRIYATCESLTVHPEKFPPDKYKRNNNGKYRAFEMDHFRISYKIMENVILIVRFRHTSMSPEEY